MYREELVKVLRVISEDKQVQWLETDQFSKKAILYKAFTNPVQKGDVVLVNVTASLLRLGTGGYDFVKANYEKSSDYEHSEDNGHIMKLRYTPMQHSVMAVESQESPFHSLFSEKFTLREQKILLAELHSMVPLVFSIAQLLHQEAKVCVIFDDQAALALSVSEHLQKLHSYEHFYSITIGQAFGGMYEATTLQTALQFATQYLEADLVVVSVGPGVVGTGTKYGFSGIEQAKWANVIGALDGIPVWIPRLSFHDKRQRQQGLSHHTRTALFQFTYARSILPFPEMKTSDQQLIEKQLSQENSLVEHDIVWSELKGQEPIIEQAFHFYGQEIKTMGRTFQDDPIFFLAVAESTKVSLGLGG
ncbi:DUF3866 family protein [Alkalihalobacillus sp. 1P02AB]|uniref:DUF3866 family protein n=1 Tax=Alkalihalobacillus sp. 1P02AB TaxID=3132260 RepID=UPI0039A6E734